MIKKHDFSHYKNVFCDSKEALLWAYANGLPSDALIRSSSPAMLWNQNENINHIESQWTEDRMRNFQSSIQSFSEKIYDITISSKSFTHEEALCIANASVFFHKVIFKAACLEKDDMFEPRLFVGIDAPSGRDGNNLNPPWDKLLDKNQKFEKIVYSLKNSNWSALSTKGVSLFRRIKLGGRETLIYRLWTNVSKYLPNSLFRKQILVFNENELLIEAAAELALKGIKIRKIAPVYNDVNIDNDEILRNKSKLSMLQVLLEEIVRNRIEEWVNPSIVHSCESLFFQNLDEKFTSFLILRSKWGFLYKEPSIYKRVLMINAPGTIQGLAISSVCRDIGIPIVSAQHGITMEICETIGEVFIGHEINVSDIFLTYNSKAKKISEISHFLNGKAIDVGISNRHLRMALHKPVSGNHVSAPIVYVSTNLYRGNLSAIGSCLTDYKKAKKELLLIDKVLNKLPYRVCYKTYPEENRRYADIDPVISEIGSKHNIDLFNSKIDMRYLIQKHQILISSLATSTLGWLVMSQKPVVFINFYNDNPLTKEAHTALSKGLFLFDSNDNLYNKLQLFLSHPIEEIERLWLQKKEDREKMINSFFTSSKKGNAGKLAAEIIYDKYLDT
jgi:hypothetical protein